MEKLPYSMGELKQIGSITTEKAEYNVDAWRGAGYSSRRSYPRPVILYKMARNDWQALEEWSSMYSKETRPAKLDTQIMAEAIKKVRFYDDTNIEEVTVNGQTFEEGDSWIQPNIESRNTKWELYRLGSQKVSHTSVTRQDLIEKTSEPYIVIDEQGEIIEERTSNSTTEISR